MLPFLHRVLASIAVSALPFVRRALASIAVSSPVAAFAVGCHAPSPAAEDAPDAPRARAEPVSPPPPVPPQERVQEAAFAAAKAALLQWNDATNAHDLRRLASLYDEQVFYYGAYLPKTAVLTSKAKAFKIMKAYRQEISEVVSNLGEFGNGTLYFTKSWGPPGRVRSLRAKLGFRAYDSGSYVIVQETDEPTENAKDPPSDECEWFAYDTVMRLPFVVKRVNKAWDDARDAGIHLRSTGPEADGRGGTLSSYGFQSGPPSEEVVAWVLRRNGEIRVTVDGNAIDVPATARKAIKEACEP